MVFLSFYRLLSALSFLSFFDLTSCQHVYLQIPWVESAVHSVTSQYSHFVHYHGPTGTAASHPRPTSLGGHHPPIPTHKPGATSCSYWLEDVKHQGIAAFNPSGSSYQVFRNVKDFGATGTMTALDYVLQLLILCR
jgi:glucan 1,3-beta-glucosidase